jgi:hypothetical protein
VQKSCKLYSNACDGRNVARRNAWLLHSFIPNISSAVSNHAFGMCSHWPQLRIYVCTMPHIFIVPSSHPVAITPQ